MAPAFCFTNKEVVAFAGSKTTGLDQDITTSLTGVGEFMDKTNDGSDIVT